METNEILNAERVLRNLERDRVKMDAVTAREKELNRDHILISVLIWVSFVVGLVASALAIMAWGPIVLPGVLIAWLMIAIASMDAY